MNIYKKGNIMRYITTLFSVLLLSTGVVLPAAQYKLLDKEDLAKLIEYKTIATDIKDAVLVRALKRFLIIMEKSTDWGTLRKKMAFWEAFVKQNADDKIKIRLETKQELNRLVSQVDQNIQGTLGSTIKGVFSSLIGEDVTAKLARQTEEIARLQTEAQAGQKD